ncbi:PREDICTED: MORN repeat-containing protein 3-like [Vollenhovia emeryi]|uniref:MORN repeat-containing protein 3-like n=1 Tax=Vollenhovia emeryi TaxID=411798 RepID=UPI0005F40079|nr:PREDICTED: MORN repeat-containing protein 3-like [Vollenhovia emeryi]
MPFLKPQRATWCEQRTKACERNGWRNAIYSPEAKRIAKAHYKGEWRNDKREGKGIGVNSHGWMYEGDWCNDLRHGYGVLSKITKDGEVRKVYAGDWVKGRKHGFGSNWYKGGSYYEGTFRENKRDGYGRLWHRCCSGYYQGAWLNDRYHGKGTLVQGCRYLKKKKRKRKREILIENGNLYEGQFANGKKEGRGVFYHLDRRQVQEGRWENDVCVNSTIQDVDCRQSALHPTLQFARISSQAAIHL